MREQFKRTTIPFWSWNGKLEKEEILRQIDDMNKKGYGGFIIHARSGLLTEYLSGEWMAFVKLSVERAKELGMEVWIYDEFGWPSGFAGGELLKEERNRENYLQESYGAYDKEAFVSYELSGEELVFAKEGDENCLNLYIKKTSSTVDILDPEVTDKFIEATHKKYEVLFDGDLKGNVAGFFTDEPQYYSHGTPFPRLIEEEFRNLYQEDVREGLGFLFTEKKGYREFRYKYRTILQSLFLNNYAKRLHGYCTERGVRLTGHYCEERDLYAQVLFCGGIMPFYTYMGMPGIDWLCRRFMTIVPVKQLESAARQLGIEDTLSESYGMTGWDTTPSELKAIAEFQMMNGVTRICQHLVPYSENGYRKYDYPVHFTSLNPWIGEGMSELNGYFDEASAFFKTHKKKTTVAVLHPVKTAYMYYKHRDEESTAWLDKGFLEFCEGLQADGIEFHFLDETIFEQYGRIDGDTLVCGKMRYETLIIPPQCESLEALTDRFLQTFVRNGGKVWVAGETPRFIEGKERELTYLHSNVKREALARSNGYSLSADGGRVRSGLYEGEDGAYLFLLNADFKESSIVSCEAGDCALYEYDYATKSAKATGGKIVLPPCGSVLLKVVKGEREKSVCEEREEIEISFSGMKIERAGDNFLVLDRARRVEKDGSLSAEKSVYEFFCESMESKEDGEVCLRFSFTLEKIPKRLFLEREKGQYTLTRINGVEAADYVDCKNETERVDVAPYVRTGENEILLKAEFHQRASVYEAKNESHTESMANKLVYDTWFDQVRLVGEFGVFARKTKEGFNENALYIDEFYLAEPKKTVTDFVSDGYPFYAGEAEFSGSFIAKKKKVSLRLTGRNYYVKAFVNDEYAGAFCLKGKLDVSAFVKTGENRLRLVVYSSARNLLGAHHFAQEEENYWVSTASFTCTGAEYRKEYSILKW